MSAVALLVALFANVAANAPAPPAIGDRLPRCEVTAAQRQPCSLPVSIDPRRAAERLGQKTQDWWLEGDTLNVVARIGEQEWPSLCCAIQAPLEPLGSDGLAALTVRVPRIEEALIDVAVVQGTVLQPPEPVRGPKAPAAPRQVDFVRGKATTTKFSSAQLGEARGVRIYIPPGPPPPGGFPVIYMADGGGYQYAKMAEASVQDGLSRPAIIVGIDNATGPSTACVRRPCDRRMLEYLPNASPDGLADGSPFRRHLSFVIDELIPFVERTYPASTNRADRILAGYSNGGVWAFSAAVLRPDKFGKVLAMSSGNASTIGLASGLREAVVFAGAGSFEPKFLGSTARRAELARNAGSSVKFREVVSGHAPAMWDVLFADGLTWLLPPSATPPAQSRASASSASPRP